MFFSINPVKNHKIYELQQVLSVYFQRCASNIPYSLDCFPEWFQSTLKDSWKLRQRFYIIARIIENQNERIRNHILAVFVNNNQIQELCENKNIQVEIIDDIEEEIDGNVVNLAEEIKDLLDYLYSTILKKEDLFDSNIDYSIKRHYEEFRKINYVCPFCSLCNYPDLKAEYDEDSGVYQDRTFKRSSYDHYLSKEYYPLSAINFHNLVPMCDECNESPNKGSKDILFTTNKRNVRRKAFYPYTNNGIIELSILCQDWSVNNIKGVWNADIKSSNTEDSEKIDTWNSIFNIFSRISNRIRSRNRIWLDQCLHGLVFEVCDVKLLREKFKAEAEKWSQYTKTTEDSVIKQAFFNYLAEAATDKQVISFCRNLNSARNFKKLM